MAARTSVLLLISLVFSVSCSYDFPDPYQAEVSVDGVDFERFFVMGDKRASGLMNGALHKGGQEYSYPHILASKVHELYGYNFFVQPETESETGFNPFEAESQGVPGRYELAYRMAERNLLARTALEGEKLAGWGGASGELRNFSIPGVRSFGLLDAGINSENPYYSRLGLPQGQSVIDLVLAEGPEVVVLDVGSESLLRYAMAGATGSTGSTTGEIGDTDLTPFPLFKSSVEQAVKRLLDESQADVILANIPDILGFPFFSTLSYYYIANTEINNNSISAGASRFREFNEMVLEYNEDIPELEDRRPTIIFDMLGGFSLRAKVIIDPDLPDAVLDDGREIPKYRQLQSHEKLLYTAEPYRFASIEDPFSLVEFGITDPIASRFVLTETEMEFIEDVRSGYNAALSELSLENDRVHLLDLEHLIENVAAEDVLIDGVMLSTEFERNGIFSADGFTLNPKGNALVANHLIELMNDVLGIQLQPVDVNNFPGTRFLE